MLRGCNFPRKPQRCQSDGRAPAFLNFGLGLCRARHSNANAIIVPVRVIKCAFVFCGHNIFNVSFLSPVPQQTKRTYPQNFVAFPPNCFFTALFQFEQTNEHNSPIRRRCVRPPASSAVTPVEAQREASFPFLNYKNGDCARLR